jgi:hypothetical protein
MRAAAGPIGTPPPRNEDEEAEGIDPDEDDEVTGGGGDESEERSNDKDELVLFPPAPALEGTRTGLLALWGGMPLCGCRSDSSSGDRSAASRS